MTFKHIKPTDEQIEHMQEFRDKFEILYDEILELEYSSRGKSLCLTKLEEANFWLNKSITNND